MKFVLSCPFIIWIPYPGQRAHWTPRRAPRTPASARSWGPTMWPQSTTGRQGGLPTTAPPRDIRRILNKTDKSALAKHTGLYHPDKTGDPSIYDVKFNNTTKSSLLRQVRNKFFSEKYCYVLISFWPNILGETDTNQNFIISVQWLIQHL